ncbi:MAG: transglutaminase family protein, partial [Hominimerdicola sp.]
MNTNPKHKLTNRLIAMLLVLAMTCVYVVGDNYAPLTIDQTKLKADNVSAQTLSFDTDLVNQTELKDVNELVLAENTTVMGKTSDSLSQAFSQMPSTVKNKAELDKAVEAFNEQISDLKAKTNEELNKTDNGTDEFNEYKKTVLSGFTDLESMLTDVSVENYEEVMSDISALLNPEKPYVSLADDLPFNEVTENNITYSDYNPESVTNYQIDDGSYSNDDLQQTNDTIINDDIRAEFSDLESVLEVYQYIKNNYMMEFYFGSRKGAVGASAEKAGNDYDIASLLIGVLRDRNIPARYAKGEIEITAEQAMEWTATDDINVAMRVISALGIPTTVMISNGETVAVRLEHVWVEAYVTYTDYRGTGNRSGERLWIPLDASFKKSTHIEGSNLESINAYINDESNYLNENSVINGVSVSNIAQMVDGQESAFVKYMLENGYDTVAQVFGGKEIVYEDLGYLPLSLPYNSVSDVEKYDDIPAEYTDTIDFKLFGNSASGGSINGIDYINEKIYTPDVYGKRLTLTYVPATAADSEVLAEHGGIFSTPAYLVKMKPQFVIDGEVIAEGPVCNTGYTQKYIITISNDASSQNDSEITNTVTVGGMYSI